MRLRPRAEVICFKGSKVLCGYNPEKGYVIFPGGGIDPNESAVEAAKREAWEEADRRVITCTIAHEPTVQIWPDGYAEAKGNKWAQGYQGGLTYWMTGSTSDEPYHSNPSERHRDYEKIFSWKPIGEVLNRLKGEVRGDWAEDVKVRIKVLQAHRDLTKAQKHAALAGIADRVGAPALSVRP